jgi:hypothetical protein
VLCLLEERLYAPPHEDYGNEVGRLPPALPCLHLRARAVRRSCTCPACLPFLL